MYPYTTVVIYKARNMGHSVRIKPTNNSLPGEMLTVRFLSSYTVTN